LAAFSETLTRKPMIVVATKLDATTDRTMLEELEKFCQKNRLEFHAISAATGEGVKELVGRVADTLDQIPKEELEEMDTAPESGAEYAEAGTVADGHDEDDESDDNAPPLSKIS